MDLKSTGFEIARAADGKLSISSQEEGFVAGITKSAKAALGGTCGSIGASAIVFGIGLPVAAAAFQKKQLTGTWSVPFMQTA